MKLCFVRLHNEDGLDLAAFAVDEKFEVKIAELQETVKNVFELTNAPEAVLWHEPMKIKFFSSSDYDFLDTVETLGPEEDWLVAEAPVEDLTEWIRWDLKDFEDIIDHEVVFGNKDASSFGLRIYLADSGTNAYAASAGINIQKLMSAEPIVFDLDEDSAPGR